MYEFQVSQVPSKGRKMANLILYKENLNLFERIPKMISFLINGILIHFQCAFTGSDHI